MSLHSAICRVQKRFVNTLDSKNAGHILYGHFPLRISQHNVKCEYNDFAVK